MVMHLFGGGGGGGWVWQTMYVMGIAKVVNNIKQANKQTRKHYSNNKDKRKTTTSWPTSFGSPKPVFPPMLSNKIVLS